MVSRPYWLKTNGRGLELDFEAQDFGAARRLEVVFQPKKAISSSLETVTSRYLRFLRSFATSPKFMGKELPELRRLLRKEAPSEAAPAAFAWAVV